jgi:NAD(P)-dependent dehydrogenase (short-subunit alcohol dehydrogenase family)
MTALKGKTALVTGGARRIGRTLCLALAGEGANIVFVYRDSQAESESLVQELAQLDCDVLAIRCDVRNPTDVHEAVAEARAFSDRLDILVNNAGAYFTNNFEDIPIEEWDTVFETNARAPFLFAQASAPALREAQGTIINIGSLGGIRAWETHVHYCASKAALHMLTQGMAKALAPEINVNAIAPGMISFGEPEGAEFAASIALKTPMQRTGTASDVASTVVWFATCPKFITGQVLAVDGGLGL